MSRIALDVERQGPPLLEAGVPIPKARPPSCTTLPQRRPKNQGLIEHCLWLLSPSFSLCLCVSPLISLHTWFIRHTYIPTVCLPCQNIGHSNSPWSGSWNLQLFSSGHIPAVRHSWAVGLGLLSGSQQLLRCAHVWYICFFTASINLAPLGGATSRYCCILVLVRSSFVSIIELSS